MNAREIMTEDPITIAPTGAIREALQILQALEIRHLPVVDDDGMLVGIVSDRDIRQIGTPYTAPDLKVGDGRSLLDHPVSEIMSSDVIAVDAEAEVDEIIDAMVDNKVGALPVLDAPTGELLGIVSYVDVLRSMRGAS
jgi:CBS domain-containing protein